jgi:uncharacterized protein (TIGR02145 family)
MYGYNNKFQNPITMKYIKRLALFVLTLTFLFSACKKDEQPPTTTPPGSTTFTDTRDGQVYNIVTIGKKSGNQQTWFAENLNYETANSWWYDNNADTGNVYGRLYTWDAARTACPAGWHLAGDEEWKILEMSLGMSQGDANDTGDRGTDEGAMLKEKGSKHWGEYNEGATNSSGFTALPGGNRDSDFFELRTSGNWWTATEYDSLLELSWSRSLSFVGHKIYRDPFHKETGFSVRCVKD